jgi:hypothetical protein
MTNGAPRLRAALFFFFMVALLGAKPPGAGFSEAELATARRFSVDFMAAIARGDEKAVKAALHPGISLTSIPEKELYALTEEMFSGRVDLARYIFSLTGHLLKKFLRGEFTWVSYRFDEGIQQDHVEGSGLLRGPILYRAGLLTYRGPAGLRRDERFELNLAPEPARKFQIVGFTCNGGK